MLHSQPFLFQGHQEGPLIFFVGGHARAVSAEARQHTTHRKHIRPKVGNHERKWIYINGDGPSSGGCEMFPFTASASPSVNGGSGAAAAATPGPVIVVVDCCAAASINLACV